MSKLGYFKNYFIFIVKVFKHNTVVCMPSAVNLRDKTVMIVHRGINSTSSKI